MSIPSPFLSLLQLQVQSWFKDYLWTFWLLFLLSTSEASSQFCLRLWQLIIISYFLIFIRHLSGTKKNAFTSYKPQFSLKSIVWWWFGTKGPSRGLPCWQRSDRSVFWKTIFCIKSQAVPAGFLTVSIQKGKGDALRTGVRFASLAHSTSVHLALPSSQFPCHVLCLPMTISDHSHASAGHMNNMVSFRNRSFREAEEFVVYKNKLDISEVGAAWEGWWTSVSPEALSSTANYSFMIPLSIWRHVKYIGDWLLQGEQSTLLGWSVSSQSGDLDEPGLNLTTTTTKKANCKQTLGIPVPYRQKYLSGEVGVAHCTNSWFRLD